MDSLREKLQKHKSVVWIVLLGYIVFNGCFVFPFSNELFGFDFLKAYMVIVGYGVIGLIFSCLLDKGKSLIVLISTFLFTAIGMACRYFLEFGEYSNTINFIPINIVLYIVIVPLYCVLAYWLTNRYVLKNN